MTIELPNTKPCDNCPGTMRLSESHEDGMYYGCPDCYAYEPVDEREILDNVYDDVVNSSATIKITNQ